MRGGGATWELLTAQADVYSSGGADDGGGNAQHKTFSGLVTVDAEGYIVWYYDVPTSEGFVVFDQLPSYDVAMLVPQATSHDDDAGANSWLYAVSPTGWVHARRGVVVVVVVVVVALSTRVAQRGTVADRPAARLTAAAGHAPVARGHRRAAARRAASLSRAAARVL